MSTGTQSTGRETAALKELLISVSSTGRVVILPPASHPFSVRGPDMGTPNLGLLLCSEPRPEAVAGHVGGGGAVFATGQLDSGRPAGAEGETPPALQTSVLRSFLKKNKKNC